MKNETTTFIRGDYTLEYTTTPAGGFIEAVLYTDGMFAQLNEADADEALQACHYDNSARLFNLLRANGEVRAEFV